MGYSELGYLEEDYFEGYFADEPQCYNCGCALIWSEHYLCCDCDETC